MSDIVLITGGTGMIGRALTDKLRQKGYQVRWLSRKRSNSTEVQSFTWDVEKGVIDEKAIDNVRHVIHLAGANIAKGSWTKKRKKEILDSRVKSGLLLARAFANSTTIKTFITASGVNYYGCITTPEIQTESSDAGHDFAALVCKYWEEVPTAFHDNVRKVVLRTAPVLKKGEGFLSRLERVAKTGLASPIGIGEQMVPWIHIDDLCAIYIQAIEDQNMAGVYNAVGGNETNRKVMEELARVLRKPFFMPRVPGFIIRIIYGELADLILEGSAISNEKLKQAGFKFKYESLEGALKSLYHYGN